MVERTFIRTALTNQDYAFKLEETVNAAALVAPKQSLLFSTTALTDTADIIFKSAGIGTANNDITQHGMIVELLN